MIVPVKSVVGKLPLNVVAVIIPLVLILTVVPIPTELSFPSSSENSISPVSVFFLIVIAVEPEPIFISSNPLIDLAVGSRVMEPVPIERIPVTLASPFTNKLVPDAPTEPTSNENLGLVVAIPTLETVLIPASVFSHKPLAGPVMVTIPELTELTFKLFPKLSVAAVPTKVPLSLIITPLPEAVIPINPEPSPINVASAPPTGPLKEIAVTTPVTSKSL